MNNIDDESIQNKNNETEKNDTKAFTLNKRIENYSKSNEMGKPYTLVEENYNKFILITLKNVSKEEGNIGYIAISENSLDIKNAIEERKNFI